MIPLIDADLLRYQVGFAAQRKGEDGEVEVSSFDKIEEHVYDLVREICRGVDSDDEPILYLTGSHREVDYLNRVRGRLDLPPLVLRPNFREAVAVTAPYKGNRTSDKPFHYDNITSLILEQYNFVVTNGIEADDAICIAHTQNPQGSIICTRDKDLRMCPGWHYGWTCGKQGDFGPLEITKIGYLDFTNSKLTGGGLLFFCAQMLTGDSVDNIKGIHRLGPAKAYKLLQGVSEPLEEVKLIYAATYGDEWKDRFMENALLLNMIKHCPKPGVGNTFGWDKPTQVGFDLFTPADIEREGPFLGKTIRTEDEV